MAIAGSVTPTVVKVALAGAAVVEQGALCLLLRQLPRPHHIVQMTDAVSPNSVMQGAILMANLVAAARMGAAVVEQGALCLLLRQLPRPHHIVQMTDAVSPNSVMRDAILMANLVAVARSMAIAG
ncbi:MAG: hypothetical protein Q9186_002537 [Xanthomendoza sp. 1 TL-2023]